MKSKKEVVSIPVQLLSFFESVLRLKSVKRAGWVSKAGISNAESVSDHTYSMCAMGMILSDMLGLDTERVMKMIIIHDLAESIIGDYMPNEITREKKRLEEGKAMSCILYQVPSVARSSYEMIWQEYQANKTRAAKFVHKLDKLEMAVQSIQYINQGYSSKVLLQFFASARRSLGKFDIDNKNLGSDIMVGILHDLEVNIIKQKGYEKNVPR
ncbi:MAG TPA: HD domain-containing protein [Nitrososphaeraceae archaeon]|jgi:putative hydrolase of HD superfamily|nr:HD domain-containing protein [Nitrososphaeraceae archaeon]HZA69344.1 HD domain-containing protein [Nitrososphaeraceae archaeon]